MDPALPLSMTTRLFSTATKSLFSPALTRTRSQSTMSTPDIYVALSSSGSALATQNAPSAVVNEVERLWSVSRANDKPGETVRSGAGSGYLGWS